MLLTRHLASVAIAMLVGAAHAATITQVNDATALANALIGPGITLVGTPTITGGAVQFGTFASGGSLSTGIGFDHGIVLSSGNVNQIPGANTNFAETSGSNLIDAADDLSTSVGSAGDAQLSALSGHTTFDAAVLQFSFQFGNG